MEGFGVRKRDTLRGGPPLRILSLDGGGVRGYSMLIILQELMHRTFVEVHGEAPRRDQIPKPCDHFDLIVGTGTGGLIALMLGRLRLDLETCKELYVRLARMVFETDKTIAGIPYKSTLFKASRLSEAIQECVREHTILEREGNDGSEPPMSPGTAAATLSQHPLPRRHLSNASVVSFSARSPAAQMARPAVNSKYGNPNAKLYDAREHRTKTALTAIYKGSAKGAPPAFLRSYDSRKEPPPDFDCTIWEAGRATCSIGLAFKAIQIGQTVFHDDGVGTFNPAPEALDEAIVNEWPGREVGVFVSVGTGKRPKSSDANSSMWYEGFLGDFSEARKRLIAKIEGCEKIHEQMIKEHLPKRNVRKDNYYRFNVEMGVGEFGMNEWHRLADISGGTRRYLSRRDEQNMMRGASSKLADIYLAGEVPQVSSRPNSGLSPVPEVVKPALAPTGDTAFELPAELPTSWPTHNTPPSRSSYDSGIDRLAVPGTSTPSPRSSAERIRPSSSSNSHSHHGHTPPSPLSHSSRPAQPPQGANRPRADEADRLVVTAPTPEQWRVAAGSDKIAIVSRDDQSNARRQPPHPIPMKAPQQGGPQRAEPPPLPPKTPLPEQQQSGGRRSGGVAPPPYPADEDGPPPVNMARKPDMRRR